MDIWMVAVAAGASCIAQHFKKLKQASGQITSESSIEGSFSVKPDSPKPPPDKKWPFRRLAKKENLKKDGSEVRSEVSQGVSSPEMASTSEFDGEKGVISGDCEGNSVFSASSLFPGFIGSDGVLGDTEGVRVSGQMGDLSRRSLTPRSRMVLRRRRAIRPLSSLENCVMAQLYTEHVEMKEYMSGLFASPSMQTVRPFLVTDGSKVINKAYGDAFIVQNNTVKKKLQTYSDEYNSFFGVPLLPNISYLEIRGKDEAHTNNTMAIKKHFNLPRGSSDATLLLCLGMSFGIISSFLANRREVEKVNGLLKQTKSLVQDLEEELEMRDSLIMQELTIDDQKPQRMVGGSSNDGSPHSVSHERYWEQSVNGHNEESVVQKPKDDDYFSKIEAELEAELEMLEMSMTSSNLERRISNLVEIDPDFEPDVVEGELRGDMLDTQSNTDRDGTSTTHSANYAVSPRELSLRLHEVLESQLEERIRELEAEIESKKQKSWKDLSSSESDENNFTVDVDEEEAVVLNLSGEALDAYNEACNEFAKFDDESEEEEETTPAIQQHQREREKEVEDDDENEDEMEKLLIKHIVEKARQGSPFVLNAQRALFSE